MSQYQRLLLVADPGLYHSPALQRAAALAQVSGAALHIAAFVEPFASFRLLDARAQEQSRERQLQEYRQWLADEAGLMRSKGIQATTEVLWTHAPLEEILLHVQALQADLLIKDLQRQPLLKRAFATPLDWQLLRDCPAPLHLVGEALHPLPQRVLAAIDSAPPEAEVGALNRRIIQAASALALQCGAQLHLLHSCDLAAAYLANPVSVSGAWSGGLVEQLRDGQRAGFDTLAEEFGVPAERRHFLLGQPILAISDFAVAEQIDVIVMGRIQRKGLNKLIGSTSEHILYRGPSSVLAVR